jgi:hypothetical protein
MHDCTPAYPVVVSERLTPDHGDSRYSARPPLARNRLGAPILTDCLNAACGTSRGLAGLISQFADEKSGRVYRDRQAPL